MAAETHAAEATEEDIWPNVTRSAALFGVAVATVSRWADEAGLGTWRRGEKFLRPRDILALAERQGRSLYDVASDLFALAREKTDSRDVRGRIRQEINDYLAEYQSRRDPARVLTQAELLDELRRVLSPAEYEKARQRLATQPRPAAADMFSADDEPSAH